MMGFMQKINFTFALFAGGLLIASSLLAFQTRAIAAGDENEILYWVAPMDANYRRDKPGKSPMGMDLVPVYKDDNAGSGTVSIAPQVVQNLGIRTALAERTRLWRGIDTVGYVDYDETRVSHIHLRTEGWVENLKVRSEGERVKRGDLLFALYSPELVNAQEEFVTALSSGNKGLIRASKERLAALGISASQINTLQTSKKVLHRISVFAPQDGVVSSLAVREGMFVKPAMTIMSLGDLSSVWLLAEVFERQTNWVHVGQPAEVKLSFIPGKTWEGKVEYIYPSLDPMTRTLKVRLRFDNPGEQLKPNMYANVKIYGGAKDNVIVIPIEGLIRTGRMDRVIIDIGEGRFEAREVSAGIESGDYVEIISGVNAGDKIVISGQFLVDSEASMRASLMRMSDAPNNSTDGSMESKPKVVTGTGVITALKPEQRKLTIQHEAVSELGWPAMTMDFGLAEDVDLSGLAPDEAVMFQLEERNERYLITAIHKSADMEMAK